MLLSEPKPECGVALVLRNQALPEYISAPATCHNCRIRHVAPTTGRVQNRCAMCGGAIVTDAPEAR